MRKLRERWLATLVWTLFVLSEAKPIIRWFLEIVGLGGSFDFLLSQSEKRGWLFNSLSFLLNPPEGLRVLILLAGIYLLFRTERRRNAVLYEPKFEEENGLAPRLARTQDQVAVLLDKNERMTSDLGAHGLRLGAIQQDYEAVLRRLGEMGSAIPRLVLVMELQTLSPYAIGMANIAIREVRMPRGMDAATRSIFVEQLVSLGEVIEQAANRCGGVNTRPMPDDYDPFVPTIDNPDELWGADASRVRKAIYWCQQIGPGLNNLYNLIAGEIIR